MKLITLQSKNTTYQIGITDTGFLLHLYYGVRINCDMSGTIAYYERGMSGVPYDLRGDNTFSCDVLPQEYPCFGNGDYRSPAFCLRTEEGVYGSDLRYREHHIKKGKYQIPGLPAAYGGEDSVSCEIVLEDSNTKVIVILRYGVFYEEDVMTRSVEVRNSGDMPVFLNKVLTSTLDFVTGEYELIHFHGRHMMERIPEKRPVLHSKQCIESRRGTSSHQQNPFVILAEKGTRENEGLCYGMSLVYSGNFLVEAEMDQFDQVRFQMGLSPEMLDYKLEAGDRFHAPEALMSCTTRGFTGLSHTFHNFIRGHICRGKYKDIPRPVLINNWEATYFDFTGEKIIQIAGQAAELGIEMLVLDDGWFGERNSDTAGLGDWYANHKKLGCTLGELSERIHQTGLKFGLWIEPEMVNEDSSLYRMHPDWVFKIPGKMPVLGRNQLVLDFSRKEVVDYIFENISRIIDSADIEYIKMDMNRSISDVYSAVLKRQNYGSIMYHYVLGVYDFLERMVQRYPGLLIEGCSSGGGRFDTGMLYYTPQIWCSDNTDAVERVWIQEGTSYGYPISAVSSHVSAVPNHQTGRSVNLYTRGIVAMAGNLGYELDLTILTKEEKEMVKTQIRDYKKYWHLIHKGDYYRVDSPLKGGEYGAWSFVAKDKSEALLSVVCIQARANRPVYYAKCPGLDLDKLYYCVQTDTAYSGAALKYVGVPVPILNEEYYAWQYFFWSLENKEEFEV